MVCRGYPPQGLSINGNALARAYNSEHQMELINECSQRFAEDKDYRLLV